METGSMTQKEMKQNGQIGCIIMASGQSIRYGKNKLLEKLGEKEVIWHVAEHLREAGLTAVTVTRSEKVKALLEQEGFDCILHSGEKKSDTMHVGIRSLSKEVSGYLFMPGDQPVVLPDTLKKLAEQFMNDPERPVRLGFEKTAGSPVLFPVSYREELLAYLGERGGMEVLKTKRTSCNVVQASFAWELWDIDTPDKMEMVRAVYNQYFQ